MALRSRSLILVPAVIGACLFAGTLRVVAVSAPPPAVDHLAAPRADRDAEPEPGRASGGVAFDAGLVEIPIEVPSASADAISL